jgi:hypothetical protein
MEGDHKQEKNIKAEDKAAGRMPVIGDILQSSGLRRALCAGDEMDGFFYRHGYYFLLHFNTLFLAILLLIKKRYS